MKSLKINVGVSPRHIHLQPEDVDVLFGLGYQLTPKKPLVELNSFVVEERVKLIGPRGSFSSVAIIIPHRKKRQIELSKTESIILGVKPPINESGDHIGAAQLEVVGPKGSLICNGVIIPKRHIHLCEKDAQELGLKAGDLVDVHFDGIRETIFPRVKVKEINSLIKASEIHIDTDEANAVGASNGDLCEIFPVKE